MTSLLKDKVNSLILTTPVESLAHTDQSTRWLPRSTQLRTASVVIRNRILTQVERREELKLSNKLWTVSVTWEDMAALLHPKFLSR